MIKVKDIILGITLFLLPSLATSQSLDQLKARYDEADKLRKQGKLIEAQNIFKQIKPQFEQINAWENFYLSWNGLATVKSKQQDAQGVLEITSEALNHCKANIGDTTYSYAVLLRSKGIGFRLSGEQDSAVFYISKAIEVLKEARGEKEPLIISYLNSLALTYKRHWDNEQALKYFNQAKEYSLKIYDQYNKRAAIADMNIAQIYNDGGQLGKAEELFKQIRKFHIDSGDTLNLRHAQLIADFGSVYRRRGWYKLSLDYYLNALDLMERLVGAEHTRVSNTCRLIGFVYNRIGDEKNAMKYINRAVETNRRLYGDTDYQTLNALIAKALITLELNKLEESIEISQNLIKLFTGEKKSMSNFLGLIYDYLGQAQTQRGDHQAAIQTFEMALKHCNDAFDFDNTCSVRAYSKLAKMYSLMGEFKKSEEYYQLVLNNQIYEGRDSTIYGGFAFVEFLEAASGRLVNFLKHYLLEKNEDILEKAIGFSESVQESANKYSDFIDQNSYREFLDINSKINITKLLLYREKYEINQDRKVISKIFYTMESNRGYLMLSKLINEEKYKYVGVPDSLIAKEKEMKMLLSQARKVDNKHLAFKYASQLKALLEQLKSYPEYFNLKYNKEVTSLETLRTKLLASNDLFVHYLQADSIMFAIAATKKNVHFFSFSSNENDPKNLYELLKSRIETGKSDQLLNGMYRNYFEPLSQLIEQNSELITNIHVIKDGQMGYLPFGLLKDDRGDYLIKKYNISEHLSASIWEKEYLPKSSSKRILGVAPTFASARQTKEGYPEIVRDKLEALPGTKREIKEIRDLLPSKVLIGEDATETIVSKSIQDYGILHFATHTIIDNANPDYSKLVLVGDTITDGYLHSYELYNMKLNAELVTLSACNTGYGEILNGEGIMSLSRAFAYAGCPNIVMSLWPVNDESTSELMSYFYQNLKNGQRKDEALRNAQLKYVQNADPVKAHPYYWAGFVFTGDPRPVDFEEGIWKNFWFLALLTLMVIGFILRKRF